MSLCVLGSHECIHRLIVGFRGWEIAVLGKKKQTQVKLTKLRAILQKRKWRAFFMLSSPLHFGSRLRILVVL